MESRASIKRMGWAACALAVLLLGLAAVTGSLARSAELDRPAVSMAAVRLAPVAGRPAGGYFMIMGGPTADRLLSVSAPAPIRVEMHETKKTGGTMSMVALPVLPVAPGAHIMFEPGGKHLMLYGVPADVKPGGKLKLTFRFEKAGPVTLDATVTAAGGAIPSHDH
ncbi:MAG: copper chaperone PCu(A)C [Alphaproteobacteria bacterium]|nr:copper chaperone PCu(A)C [Alphaproteobacteria bacterium]